MRETGARPLTWVFAVLLLVAVGACSTGDDDADSGEEQAAATTVAGAQAPSAGEVDTLSPAEAVVSQFLRAIDEDDLNSAYSTLSAPARIELGFRDGLEDGWDALVTEFEGLAETTLEERLVPSLPFDLRAVVVDGSRVMVVRQEGGQLQVEPRAPLDPNASVPTVVQVPGTSVEIRVDPVQGAVVRSATGEQGTGGGGDVAEELIGLSRGSRGQPVREWQGLLARWAEANGRTPPVVDGVFGRGTEGITREAEASFGLPADGVVDADLVAAMVADLS